MDAKKIRVFRRHLWSEHDKLVQSISRARRAEEEVGMEKTEDEGDLATISQERDLLSFLHESVSTRLRFIREALNAVDRGDYGECSRCGEDIGEKRLAAVPWARTCIFCQEATETEPKPSRISAGTEAGEQEF